MAPGRRTCTARAYQGARHHSRGRQAGAILPAPHRTGGTRTRGILVVAVRQHPCCDPLPRGLRGGTRPHRSTHRSRLRRSPACARGDRCGGRTRRRRLPAQPALRSLRDDCRRRTGPTHDWRRRSLHQAIGAIGPLRGGHRRTRGRAGHATGRRRPWPSRRRSCRAPRHIGTKQGLHARRGFRAAGERRTVALEATPVREPRQDARSKSRLSPIRTRAGHITFHRRRALP